LEGYNDRLAYFSKNLLPVIPPIQVHLLLSDAGELAALLASAVPARSDQKGQSYQNGSHHRDTSPFERSLSKTL